MLLAYIRMTVKQFNKPLRWKTKDREYDMSLLNN